MSEFKEPNKSKGENGYKNRRGVDVLADMLPDFLGGKAVKAKRQHKANLEKKRS
jgi:hypothetical protein